MGYGKLCVPLEKSKQNVLVLYRFKKFKKEEKNDT